MPNNSNVFKEMFLLTKKPYSLSNCEMNPMRTNKKKTIKSTILSATIVPKALSNGIFSYFFIRAAREISPERGTVKFTK